MKLFYILSTLFIPFSCNNNPSTVVYATKPVENIVATKDQRERREKSEAYCKQYNIPVYSNPNSLFVDPESEVKIRSLDEIIDRASALCYIGLKSEGLEQKYLNQFDKDFGILSKLTPNENAYVTSIQPTEQQKTDANWRYESLHVMLWAMGFVDTLGYPNKMCIVANDVRFFHDFTKTQLSQKAKLRSKKEILDQADLILRVDWACVNARLKNQTAPGNLDVGVVSERHYSLNWLINYMQQQWDDVKTDT
jgi:hypothetical protein